MRLLNAYMPIHPRTSTAIISFRITVAVCVLLHMYVPLPTILWVCIVLGVAFAISLAHTGRQNPNRSAPGDMFMLQSHFLGAIILPGLLPCTVALLFPRAGVVVSWLMNILCFFWIDRFTFGKGIKMWWVHSEHAPWREITTAVLNKFHRCIGSAPVVQVNTKSKYNMTSDEYRTVYYAQLHYRENDSLS